LLDYNDLLLLALKLLKENKSVCEYYQNLAHFVIEDEAQDSSKIQQNLIEILSGKYGNIIRCGDVNQSITSTFSNSDVEGFKHFIKENNPIKMDCSQRCSKQVYSLANKLIDYSISKGTDAFLDVKMRPVGDKNPVDKKELEVKIFGVQQEEREFVVREIQNIFKNDKNANIGVLLRSNWSLDEWASFIEGYNIKVKTKTGALLNNSVFSAIFAVLKFIEMPDNKNILKCAYVLNELGFYNDYLELEKYVKNLKEPFIINMHDDFPIWFDLNYFMKNCDKTILELSLIIGSNYFKKNPQKANVTIISTFIDKIFKQEKTYEKTTQKLGEISKKPNYRGVNLFEEENEEEKGVVEIMTMHKSKGDEFDYVFVPELTESNLPLDFKEVKLHKNAVFIESLKTEPKSDDELKKQIADEDYRLLYVAITRAKKRLYLTSALKYKEYNKMKDEKINPVFEEILEVKY
jgi:DNA helicase-2/ATP-dependent DNA helicase PcrA